MNKDELSVHADELQIEGDIRGEIIALELLAEETGRADLWERHRALVHTWLGTDVTTWTGTHVRHAFVDCTTGDLARVLASPAAPYLRSVFVAGTNTDVVNALALLAAAPRRHLARLSITSGRRWTVLYGERNRRATALVADVLARALIAATPNLVALDVHGARIFDAFPHPRVERLRVRGHDAIGALVETGPACPAARSLSFAFSTDPAGRIAFGPHGLPSTLFAKATLPALVELDLSANEVQRSWDDGHAALFELLPELGVLPQLARLRVPVIATDAERDLVAHVQTLTRAAIEDTSALPHPLHDELAEHDTLGIRIGRLRGYTVSHRRLGELVALAWPDLDADDRAAWFALWHALGEVVGDPADYWNIDGDGVALPRATFAAAFATLSEEVLDEDFALARFATDLLATGEAEVYVRRYPY